MNDYSKLPATLVSDGLFCLWRYEERNGKRTKVPYNARTGGKAQPNNPDTFVPYTEAVAALEGYSGLGVGIFNGICAIDIDHCIDDTGTFSDLAQEIISTMGSYTETSPSGKGIRILFKAPGFKYDKTRFYINNQKIGLEVYIFGATQKYVTVTGNSMFPAFGLEERAAELQAVLNEHMQRPRETVQARQEAMGLDDMDIIVRAKRAKNGNLFESLWGGDTTGYSSPSEADIALCNILAFYTGRDAGQMDRLFRASGLMRDKWDRDQSGSTYGAITIDNAIRNCRDAYNPQSHFQKKATALPPSASGESLADLHPDKNDRYGWHDMGNGYLFADWFKDSARYVPERKKWFIYRGGVWQADVGDLMVSEMCKKLADALMVYALSIPNETQKQTYMKHITQWQRRSYRETIIKDAASVYPVSIAEFDKNPFLLNCQNGTLDLKAKRFHAHNPADYLSKIAGVHYDPAADCPRWTSFIDEVMRGDKEKAVFLQKALGYTLTGDTRHECFFVLYGPTSRNGKGTTMETYMRLMGDYGSAMNPDSIGQKQNSGGSGPSDDIARLAGARFVNISEPDKRLVLSVAKVKAMTGNDTITARFLHENSFEYRPQFKLFVNTNHLPQVTDITLFSSGRVKTIPFDRHFTEAERDEGLKAELAKPESLSGILNWCVEGLAKIDAEGFTPPLSVQAATEEYRMNSDKIGRFLLDEMEKDITAECRTAEAYSRYQIWCASNGFHPENSGKFKTELENYGPVTRKRPKGSGRDSNPQHLFLGYRLRLESTGFSSLENAAFPCK